MKNRGNFSFNNNFGFGILEVGVASALGLALIVFLAQNNAMMSKQARSTALSGSWNNVLNLMRTTYANPERCQNMFKDIVVNNDTNNKIDTPLTALGIKDSTTGAFTNKFLEVNKTVNGIYTSQIRLKSNGGTITTTTTSTPPQTILSDQVWLYIQGNKVLTVVSGPTSGPPVVSGATPTDSDTISFVITRDSVTKKVIDCQGNDSETSCGNLDGTTSYLANQNTGTHAGHTHKPCSVKTLNLNPKDEDAKGILAFGEAGTDKIEGDSAAHSITLNSGSIALTGDSLTLKAKTFDAVKVQYFKNSKTTVTNVQQWKCIFDGKIYDTKPECMAIVPYPYGPPYPICSNPMNNNDPNRCQPVTVPVPNTVDSDDANITIAGNLTVNRPLTIGTERVTYGCTVRSADYHPVKCNPGEIAVGGGGECDPSSDGLAMVLSGPLVNVEKKPTGWFVKCKKSDGTLEFGTWFTAICCKE